MKAIRPQKGFHHVSIFALADHALGCTRSHNTKKLLDWLTNIAEESPHIISIETLVGEDSPESQGCIFMRIIYTNKDGLARVRSSVEHREMMTWFEQVRIPQRMNVDSFIA